MIHVQTHGIIKVRFQKKHGENAKNIAMPMYSKSPIKHGIINVHFQKTWY